MAATIPAPHNARWDNLPPPDGLRPDYAKAMGSLVEKQQAVGKRKRPVLAIWGADVASEEELETFRTLIVNFLKRIRPARLMISGRRAVEIATPAEQLLRHALGAVAAEDVGPRQIITGGADGVDSLAVRIAHDDSTRTVVGQYTPTAFARADVEAKLNPTPVQIVGFQGLEPGASPLRDAEEMALPPSTPFPEFIALMEGQWEARDTHNTELADACIAFLSAGKTGHDGTKASLNIFADGRYAHPPAEGTASQWEVEADRRSSGVVALSGGGADDAPTSFVGYKILNATRRFSMAFLGKWEGSSDDDAVSLHVAEREDGSGLGVWIEDGAETIDGQNAAVNADGTELTFQMDMGSLSTFTLRKDGDTKLTGELEDESGDRGPADYEQRSTRAEVLQEYALQECAALRRTFAQFDADGAGAIRASELALLLRAMGGDAYTADEIEEVRAQMGTDASGVVEWGAFLRWWAGDERATPLPAPRARNVVETFRLETADSGVFLVMATETEEGGGELPADGASPEWKRLAARGRALAARGELPGFNSATMEVQPMRANPAWGKDMGPHFSLVSVVGAIGTADADGTPDPFVLGGDDGKRKSIAPEVGVVCDRRVEGWPSHDSTDANLR